MPAAAADVRLARLTRRAPGSAAAVARLRANALRVREVTRVVIRDRSPASDAAARPGSQLGQELARRRAPAPRTRARAPPTRGRREQLAVLLHRRPAAGGVDDDRGRRRLASKASIGRRAKRARLARAAGVQRERAAAALVGGATTSQPSAREHLIVAAFTRGRTSRCTQPVSRPTVSAPRADAPAYAPGAARSSDAHVTRRRERQQRAEPAGSRRISTPGGRTRDPQPWSAAATSGASTTRSRFGYGNEAKIAARNSAIGQRAARSGARSARACAR